MNQDSQITNEVNNALVELVSEYGYAQREPGDITIADLQQATGLGMSRAADILRQKVKSGEYVKLRAKGENDKPINIYRKVK